MNDHPQFCRETVFEDGIIRLERLWRWPGELHPTDTAGGDLTLAAYSAEGKILFSPEGDRLRGEIFDDVCSFNDGLAAASVRGKWGFIDPDGGTPVPFVFDEAENFFCGKARAVLNGKSVIIDKRGEVLFELPENCRQTHWFFDGTLGFSTIETPKLDYYDENEFAAGYWVFLNERGEEIVPPQYIYALGHDRQIALVCRGEWKRQENGRYRAEGERWGAIDKSGNVVIPFEYENMCSLWDESEDKPSEYILAYRGGRVGIIDTRGRTVAEPVSDSLLSEVKCGMILFKRFSDGLYGVCDIESGSIIFDARFDDVEILGRDRFIVKEYDENRGRSVAKLVDRQGREVFESDYDMIIKMKNGLFEVCKNDGERWLKGITDENGRVVLPCEYELCGIASDMDRAVYRENGRFGLMDLKGNRITPPRYDIFQWLNEYFTGLLLSAGVKDENGRLAYGFVSLDGVPAVPCVYSSVYRLGDYYYICGGTNGFEVMKCTKLSDI